MPHLTDVELDELVRLALYDLNIAKSFGGSDSRLEEKYSLLAALLELQERRKRDKYQDYTK